MIKEIKEAQLRARKEKNKWAGGILTALISEISIIGKNDGNRETTSEEAEKVVRKFKKGVEDIILAKRNSGCNARDLGKFYNEIKLYNMFLPQMMSEEDLRKAIDAVAAKFAMPNIGAIMGSLKSLYGSTFDGKMASKIIKEKLNAKP